MRFRQFMDQCIDDDTKKLGGIIKKPAPSGESELPPDPPVVEPGDIPNLPKDKGDAAPKSTPPAEEKPAEEKKEEPKEPKEKEPKEPAEKKEPKDEEKEEDGKEDKDEEEKPAGKKGGFQKKTNESFGLISELRQMKLTESNKPLPNDDDKIEDMLRAFLDSDKDLVDEATGRSSSAEEAVDYLISELGRWLTNQGCLENEVYTWLKQHNEKIVDYFDTELP